MRPTIAALMTAAAVTLPGGAWAFTPYIEGGAGFPELVHLRAGAFLLPRLSVEVYGGIFLFNPLAGIGATGYLLGEVQADAPPIHAWLVNGAVVINPTLFPPRLTSGAETVGGALMLTTGYQYSGTGGFIFRVYSGVVLGWEETFAWAPTLLSAGLGYRF